MEQNKLSNCDRYQKAWIRFDLYAQPFRLLLPDKKDTYRTFTGALMSILSLVLVSVYAGFKINTLVRFSDYKI